MALDTNSTVWNFETWGGPYRLVSHLLDCSSPETTPMQIQCSTSFSAVLTRSGDVYMWTMHNSEHRHKSARAIVSNSGVPCHTWKINMDPAKLPSLPDLPDLPMNGLAEEERRKETKLIKIATCLDNLVGLTNKGHVLRTGSLCGEDPTWAWDYVSESSWMTWHPFLNRDM